jgi:hypothetical protein
MLSVMIVFIWSCRPERKECISGSEGVDHKDKMEWFADAKLYIFIHWGVYSTTGKTP